MKQTAIDWLIDVLSKNFGIAISDNIIEQAKEIENEQQKYFFECGRNFQLTGEGTFEQYYNETFKQ